ncbi:MAG TPA: ribonuclease H family protein [Bacteroidales bacterium]|nr:ribonuclease H family protein [Bacteroidales bacterium]HRZ76727.1 ribonuclease H family protein [Bacteroidales bacterium]
MSKKNKNTHYVVWRGKVPGVYPSWAACKEQVDGVEGALYKGFENEDQAWEAFSKPPHHFIGKKAKLIGAEPEFGRGPDTNSLAVDAACSGNPGVLEYRGVDTRTGAQLFHQGPFEEGTVNIGEFLAIVHALAFLHERNLDIPVYSDSRTAIKWVKDKKANTKLPRSARNARVFELIERAERWLAIHRWKNPVLKWETSAWGEVPADFGRK